MADPHWNEDVKRTENLIRTARKHVGHNIKLMCDAATAWTNARQGLPFLPVFKECNFEWLEAPLPLDDIKGHAEFVGHGIPITGGDLGLTTCHEYKQILDDGKVDIVQPDISMMGGLTEFQKLCKMVHVRNRRIVTHGYKTNITIAMNLNVLSQHWTEEPLEYSTSESPLRWTLTNENFEVGSDGKVLCPKGPGLGVSLNLEALERFSVA